MHFCFLQNLKAKLFGKDHNKENTGFVMPHQYHELEDLLSQERSSNRQLHEQITKARAEIVALKSGSKCIFFKLDCLRYIVVLYFFFFFFFSQLIIVS